MAREHLYDFVMTRCVLVVRAVTAMVCRVVLVVTVLGRTRACAS